MSEDDVESSACAGQSELLIRKKPTGEHLRSDYENAATL